MSCFYVYILYSSSADMYYVGSTNDIERRLSEHNRIKGKFTDRGMPWRLVYKEVYPDRGQALSRELSIKKMKSRQYIEDLISRSDRLSR